MTHHRVNRPEPLVEVAEAARFGWRDWLDPRRVGWSKVFLVFVPLVLVLGWLDAPPVVLFGLALLAILPLAGLMGEATEHLAHRAGPGIGGLLNATFGNAAELIIALMLLFRGTAEADVIVKASITGSILGNLLLVLGLAILAGGSRYREQRFNRTAAGVGATMLALAAFGLLVPAIFHALPEVVRVKANDRAWLEHELSLGVCVVLMLGYGAHLLFSLKTHQNLFNPEDESPVETGDHAGPVWGVRRALITLTVATVFVALVSEVLAHTIGEAGRSVGMTNVFLGVIVVAIVGNAAEHASAVIVAMKNKMDLAIGIALGSALQVSLFVAPVLVFASYLRDHPLDLLFTPMEVVAVLGAVAIARMVAEDGESNWLEGVMLLLVYAILAVVFFVLPEEGTPRAGVAPAVLASPAEPGGEIARSPDRGRGAAPLGPAP